MAKKKKIKLKFVCEEEIELVIDKYFNMCKGEFLQDEEGNIIYNKMGEPIITGDSPLTVSGLAQALGFESKQDLFNYEGKFRKEVAGARLRVERYIEERLYDKEGLNGAKFVLSNNFQGWSDKGVDEGQIEVFEKLDSILEGIGRVAGG